MNNSTLLDLFAVIVYAALCIFLWEVILPITREKLEPKDRDTAKYFLIVFSFILLGLGVHAGFAVMSSVFDFTDPL
jgi:hypothetical protein